MTVEELQVLISANADQFTGELLKVQNELRKLNKTTEMASGKMGGQLFGSMIGANIVTGVLTKTVAKLGQTLSGLFSQMIEGGSALSRLRIANSAVTANLGMTSESVQKLRDDLAEANTYGINAENIISTLALSGLVKLAEGLEYVDARSGEAEKGVTALTLGIKDLSAARGIDSDLGIERVSKFIQRGNAELADGLIEIGEINREYKAYADTIGKNVESLTALEKSQVRMNIVMQEAQKSFGAYAATYNSSGKIFSSIKMLLRSLTAEIGSYFEPVMRTVGRAILEFFQGIQGALFNSSGTIKDLANKIAGYLVALIRIIGRLGSSLPFVGAGFQKLANFTLKPIQAQGKMQESLGGTGQAMDETGQKADALKKKMEQLAGFDEMTVLTEQGGTDGGVSGVGAVGGGLGEIGGGLAGVEDSTEQIMGYATQAEQAISDMLKPFKDLRDRMKEIKVLGTPLWDIFKKIGKALLITIPAIFAGNLAFKGLMVFLQPAISLFQTLWGLLPQLQGVFTTIGTAIGGVSSTLLVVVGVIALIVAGIVSAWQNSEEFRNSILDTWAKIQEVFMGIVGVIQEKIPAFLQAIDPLIQAVGTFLKDAFKFLGEVVAWLWLTILKPLVDFILKNIVPAYSLWIDILIAVIGVFAQVIAVILSVVMPVIRTLWTVITTVFEAIGAIISWVWNTIIKPVFNFIYSLITGLVIPIFKTLWNWSTIVFNAIATVVKATWDKIYQAIKPVIDWIGQHIMPVVNKIKDGMVKAFEKIKEVGSNIFEGIKEGFKQGINWIIDKVNWLIRKVNSMVDSVNSAGASLPGWTNITFKMSEIPKLAKGAVVKEDTLAMLHKSSNEAVVPLEGNTEWISTLAEKLNTAGAGAEGATIVVKLGEKTIFEDFVDYVNDRTLVSNRPILNI